MLGSYQNGAESKEFSQNCVPHMQVFHHRCLLLEQCIAPAAGPTLTCYLLDCTSHKDLVTSKCQQCSWTPWSQVLPSSRGTMKTSTSTSPRSNVCSLHDGIQFGDFQRTWSAHWIVKSTKAKGVPGS